MKILVIGGAGYIGSHLCEELIKDQSNKVYCLDNYFTGQKSNYIEGVCYFEDESKNIKRYLDILSDVDLVYHLGEYSRVEQSFEDISLVMDYNIKGTIEVLEFIRNTNAKLIYAGSSTKFADTKDYIQSPYAWSKQTNTELVKKYGEWFNINYAITYFYNVFGGPREIACGKYATLIGKYTTAVKYNRPLEIVLPGTQQRNFTYIDDVVSALILIGKYGKGDNYGIGFPKAYTITEIAYHFDSTNVKFLPERKGNRLLADVITDKTRDLGWNPTISVIEYINELKKCNWDSSKAYKFLKDKQNVK